LIAIDMDGTLLDPRGELSPANRQVISELQQSGYYVTLATGRVHQSAAYYAQQLSLQSTIISHQGAVMTDSTGKKLFEHLLSPTLAADLVDYAKEFPVSRGYFFNNDEVAVERDGDHLFTAHTHFS